MFLVYPGGGWLGLIVLFVTAAISWFFLRNIFFRNWTGQVPVITQNGEDHMQVLKRRYANGEISRDEYLRMRDELKD